MSRVSHPVMPDRAILPEWFQGDAGQALIGEEIKALPALIPEQFYRVGLQYGLNEQPLLRDCNVELAVYCDTGCTDRERSANNVLALPEALPLAESSVDIAMLLHTLDYCENPHGVLREVSQVLSPEGVLVLTGFHPYSLWGAERVIRRSRPPHEARFISRKVVQDWLELLGFQSLTGCMLNYQFSSLNASWRKRLGWMNRAGDRWWPTLGAVYVLVVQKKMYSGIGVKRPIRLGAKWFPELKPAQARVAHQRSIHRQGKVETSR